MEIDFEVDFILDVGVVSFFKLVVLLVCGDEFDFFRIVLILGGGLM